MRMLIFILVLIGTNVLTGFIVYYTMSRIYVERVEYLRQSILPHTVSSIRVVRTQLFIVLDKLTELNNGLATSNNTSTNMILDEMLANLSIICSRISYIHVNILEVKTFNPGDKGLEISYYIVEYMRGLCMDLRELAYTLKLELDRGRVNDEVYNNTVFKLRLYMKYHDRIVKALNGIDPMINYLSGHNVPVGEIDAAYRRLQNVRMDMDNEYSIHIYGRPATPTTTITPP